MPNLICNECFNKIIFYSCTLLRDLILIMHLVYQAPNVITILEDISVNKKLNHIQRLAQ